MALSWPKRYSPHAAMLPALLGLTILVATPVSAASLTTIAPPFQINSISTRGDQDHPAVAMNSEGLFLVAWSSDSDKFREVKGRAFYPDGTPWTSEFLVNKIVQTGSQFSPDVDCNGNSTWVVGWPSWEDHHFVNVYTKLYSSANAADQSEFLVNKPPATASQLRTRPDVAMFPNGDFIGIWSSADIQAGTLDLYVRLFDDQGHASSQLVQLNQSPCEIPPGQATATPDIAVHEIDGHMWAFAAWKRYHDNGDGTAWADIIGRRFDLHAMVFEDEIVVAPADSQVHQDRPIVCMNASGDILAALQEIDPADGLYNIRTRMYHAATETWTDHITPPGNDIFEQHRAEALLTDQGETVLAWTRDLGGETLDDIFIQFYDAQGTPLLPAEYMVNATTLDRQRRPALAMTTLGSFMRLAVVWESAREDGSGLGIIGAVYDFDGFSIPAKIAGPALAGNPGRPLHAFDLEVQANEPALPAVPRPDQLIPSIAPNPFNPRTVVGFRLDEPATVTLSLYDLAGRRARVLVQNRLLAPGEHRFTWDGTDETGRPLPSGSYLVRLQAAGRTGTRLATLVR